jgi:integrase
MLPISPTLTFCEAARRWLDRHKANIRPKSLEGYRYYIKTLNAVFGNKLLSQITVQDILEYQHRRKAEVSAGLVNHELNTVKQILDAADLWAPIGKYYKQLKPSQWTPPKVLSPEDEKRFFVVANSKPQWQVAAWACIVAANTSAVGQELYCLQLQHIFLDHAPPKLHVNDARVKNEFRARVIPLNPAAADAMTKLVERAKALGAYAPQHYVFPFRAKRNQWDVTRHASPSFIRRGFEEIREAAGLPWLHPRHFRNQCITRLFEVGAPDETVMSIAGHQSIRMSRHYSRIRIESKAEALNSLTSSPKKPQSVRPHVRSTAQAMDATAGFSVSALVAQLKRVGMKADQILDVVTGLEG